MSSLGGPIDRDKLWFFAVLRNQGNSMSVPGMWANLNAGNDNSWSYEPDLSSPARGAGKTRSGQVRLTWQISEKNKLTGFWDEQWGCSGARWPGSTAGSACRDNTEGWIIGGSATSSPETVDLLDAAEPDHAGELGEHTVEQSAARRRMERVQQPMGRRSRAGQSHHQSDRRVGAGREHPGSVLPLVQSGVWR